MKSPPLLKALRLTDKEALQLFPFRPFPGFDRIGLRLKMKLVYRYYESCTPTNCWTFASTGGNGVHFSLLEQNGEVADDSIVVMTNPGGMGHSCIVGEGLHDFLCLGAIRGYFALEQLTYNPKVTLQAYTNRKWQPSEKWHYSVGLAVDNEVKQMMSLLTDRFELRPWTSVRKFAHLQESYKDKLDLPPDFLGMP